MTAAQVAAQIQTLEPTGWWTIEAEEQVTKEVRYHVLKNPAGEPAGFFRNLEAVLDALADHGAEVALLTTGPWRVIVHLDFAAQLAGIDGGPDIG